jgi:hypothetical protein
MKRSEFTSAAMGSTLVVVASGTAQGAAHDRCGAKPSGKHGRGSFARTDHFANGPQATEPDNLAGTPLHRGAGARAARVLLAHLPPVVNQDDLQACEAHAFGYGLGGYTAAHHANGTVRHAITAPAMQPSRAWLFAHELKEGGFSCKQGTFALGYLEQLAAFGAPSEQDVPYCADCAYIERIDLSLDRYPRAHELRIGSYKTMVIRHAEMAQLLPKLKGYLANGHVIAFCGPCGTDYDDPVLSDGVYHAGSGFTPNSGHGQIVVGYDDAQGKHGAFLVQNSWGTTWPKAAPGGRIWWDYDTFFGSQTCAAIAYPAKHGPPLGRALHASVPGAPAATIASVKTAPYAKGQYELILVHEFSAPVRLQRVSLKPPHGHALEAASAMTLSNGYSIIQSPRPWREAKGTRTSYELTIEARVNRGTVIYSGKISV